MAPTIRFALRGAVHSAAGCVFRPAGYSTLPDLVLVLCMGFAVGAPLLRALSFMAVLPQLNYKIESLER